MSEASQSVRDGIRMRNILLLAGFAFQQDSRAFLYSLFYVAHIVVSEYTTVLILVRVYLGY